MIAFPHVWTQQKNPPELTRLTSSPKVVRGLNHSWQALCSIILRCPVGTSAAYTDNLVLNREECRLRIWSNYLYIKRPRWNRRTSDAGSARTRQWKTSRGLDESVECEWSHGGGFIFTDSLFIVCFSPFGWCWLENKCKKTVSRGYEGVAEQANKQSLISIYCNCWEDDKHFIVCPVDFTWMSLTGTALLRTTF